MIWMRWVSPKPHNIVYNISIHKMIIRLYVGPRISKKSLMQMSIDFWWKHICQQSVDVDVMERKLTIDTQVAVLACWEHAGYGQNMPN